jgi:hypothetical protein
MNYSDSFSDRHAFSTDTNEYATGLNDENEWDENIMDYDIPFDDRIDDRYGEFDNSEYVYNESGYDRERIY